jgi:hypothetical protein
MVGMNFQSRADFPEFPIPRLLSDKRHVKRKEGKNFASRNNNKGGKASLP